MERQVDQRFCESMINRDRTSEEDLEQPFRGFEKTAGNLGLLLASSGNEAPKLAVKPAKSSPSTPSTQTFTLTWMIRTQFIKELG